MRDLIRAREVAVKTVRQARQRIQGFLLRHGRRYVGAVWKRRHRVWLGKQSFDHPAQQITFQSYLNAMVDRKEFIDRQIAELVRERSLGPVVVALQALRGVALVVAAGVVSEVGDMRRLLLAEIRTPQEELGNRTGGALRESAGGKSDMVVHSSTEEPVAFARGLGNDLARGEPRATHRRPKRRYKKRVRMPSKLDPHVALTEGWLAAEPQLTAIAIVGRLAALHPDQLGKKQHSIVQRLLRALRKSGAQRLRRPPRDTRTSRPALWTARSRCRPPRPPGRTFRP